MKCQNHQKTDSVGTCVSCGGPFCDSCMMKVGRKNLCKDCAGEQLTSQQQSNNSTGQPNITITQQTTQQTTQQSPISDKPRGSGFWLCFWIIIFWPVAIVYFLMRRWS